MPNLADDIQSWVLEQIAAAFKRVGMTSHGFDLGHGNGQLPATAHPVINSGDLHPEYATDADLASHAANNDAHHSRQHAIDGADHSGTLALTALSSGAATTGQLPEADGAGGIAWADPVAGGAPMTDPMTTVGDMVVQGYGGNGAYVNASREAGAVASASTSYSTRTPEGLNDGLYGPAPAYDDGWLSNFEGAGAWGELDLGAAKEIKRFRVTQFDGYARTDWKLQYSTDNAVWSDAHSQTVLTLDTGLVDITPVTARYWRVLAGANGQHDAWGVWELELYRQDISDEGGDPERLPYDGDGRFLGGVAGRPAWVASPVTAHVAASDPHAQYQQESEKGAANGYAGLGADGKVPSAQLPAAGASLTVKEQDGAPSVANVSEIRVTNGTVTDEGGGVVSIEFGAAATDGAAIHDNEAGEIAALTEKATPVDGDWLLIEDSAASNAKKKIQVGNLPGGTSGSLTVQDAGGSPSVANVTTIKLPDGNLVDEGGGVVYLRMIADPLRGHWGADGSITKDGADLVSVVEDQSPSGIDMNQAVATNQPLWVDNIINGQPVLRFDGVDNYLAASLPSADFNGRLTMAIVLRPRDAAATKGLMSWASALGSGGPFVLIQRDTTNVRFFVNGGYRITVAHATDATKLYVLTWDGAAWSLYVDGGTPTTYAGAGFVVATTVYLGNGYNGYAYAEIPELYLYSKVLSAGERSALTTTLKTKYGIA
ncbi:MAG: galactose-binding domain-containing protein [Chloroflexota bacterium]